MSRNAAIKRFDARQTGQPIDLFDSVHGKAPVILELLATPWMRRVSDLPSGDGAGKRTETAIAVDWDGERARPMWFEYRGKRYPVDTVVQQWAVERSWWDRRAAVSRRCFRVLARGGVWDLAYDRAREEWLLVGVVD
ncbi:MAG TPA: DUF6504 family protein [Coriobacteriia bacterium]